MPKNNLPVILLKGLVLLPLGEARIELNNDITKKIIDMSKKHYDDLVLIVTPNTLEEMPDSSDLPLTGVVAKITSRIDLPNGITRILLSGLYRAKVLNYINNIDDKDILESNIVLYPKYDYNKVEETALFRKLSEVLEIYISKNPYVSNSILNQIRTIDDLEKLTDYIGNFVPFNNDKKIELMHEPNRITRARKLINELNIEISILELENKIDNVLKKDLDDMQKEMILKEKIKIIKNELGEKDSKSDFIESIKEKIDNNVFPENISSRLKSEISRYENTLDNNPELATIRNYIDTVVSIPFGIYSDEEKDLKVVKEKLDISHYALTEVKTRILEYVAVKMNSNSILNVLGRK